MCLVMYFSLKMAHVALNNAYIISLNHTRELKKRETVDLEALYFE
jgi:hypothetical protein